MNIETPARQAPRHTLLAASIAAWSALCYAAYGWTALVSLDLHDEGGSLLVGLTVLTLFFLVGIARPIATAMLVLLVIPLFGNHPGGRLMELINLPLAASAAGLAIEARLQRKPPLGGNVWLAAALLVASAIMAMVPALPGMIVPAAQLNHWPTAVAAALTAPEVSPLYSLSSLLGVTLAVAWAAALAWRAPDVSFYRAAARMLIWSFFAVVALGVLDYYGVISLASSYLLRVDPRRPDASGLQSIFWNPGWFAWYFAMLFGLAAGFLWSAGRRERLVLAVLLAGCYVFSFLNPQRGGLVAVHVCLALAGWLWLRTTRNRRAARRFVAIAAVALVAGIAAAYSAELIPRGLGSSLFRLIEAPDEATTSTSNRVKLWTVATRMWRDAPLFGVGEGSFGWRFEQYAPRDSALFTTVHGDAHSTWFQTLATRGLAGVTALVVVIWAVGRAMRHAARDGAADRGLLIGAGLSLAAFLVYSTVQAMFYLQAIQILFWFLVSLIAAAPAARRPAATRWVPVAAAAAVAVAALAAQGWAASDSFARAAETIDRQPRGFYGVESADNEGRWRWSAAERATLCLQPLGPLAELRMSADDPRPHQYPRSVTIRVNDVVARNEALNGPEPTTVVVAMPWWSAIAVQPEEFGECTGRPDDVRVTIEVDRTWNPLADGLGPDPRTFGVRVFEPVYHRAEELLQPGPERP